jgi:hypothetical protein
MQSIRSELEQLSHEMKLFPRQRWWFGFHMGMDAAFCSLVIGAVKRRHGGVILGCRWCGRLRVLVLTSPRWRSASTLVASTKTRRRRVAPGASGAYHGSRMPLLEPAAHGAWRDREHFRDALDLPRRRVLATA